MLAINGDALTYLLFICTAVEYLNQTAKQASKQMFQNTEHHICLSNCLYLHIQYNKIQWTWCNNWLVVKENERKSLLE